MEDFERPLTPEQNKKYLRDIAAVLIFIGIVILVIFICNRIYVISEVVNGKPDMSATGEFGDFVGGFIGTIFSLAGSLLLFYTLMEQRDNFTQERLESKLYEMVKIHRDNVAEMEFTYYDRKMSENKKEFETAKGRKVFKIILDQFKEVWHETEYIFLGRLESDIYSDEYLRALKENEEIKRRNVDLLLFARIDIDYLIIFFGVAKDGQAAISEIIAEKYKPAFVNKVLQYAALKPKVESDYYVKWKFIHDLRFFGFFEKIIDFRNGGEFVEGWINVGPTYFDPANYNYPDDYEKYYGGHQFRLGHYYRHMFQLINFIDNNFDSVEKKKEHMNFFRAQISIYEQYVYLFNSLSTLGRTAELETRKAPFVTKPAAKHLISKYNILRNIPNDEVVPGVSMKNFYPDIDYEAITNVGVDGRRKELGYD